MTTVQIEAGTLTASLEERTVTGLLLPYGEVGNTNLGKFEIEPGAIRIPRDASVVGANTDHLREEPVGRATILTDTEAGIVATFKVADTDEGDQLLLDIESGERSKLSAEVKGIVIRAGKAIAGQLFGAAFVAKGAFPSAALLAADVGDVEEDEAEEAETPEAAIERLVAELAVAHAALETTEEAPALEATETPTETEETVNAVPNTLTATAPAVEALSSTEAFRLLAAKANGKADGTMLARLDETFTPSGSLFAALTGVAHSGVGAVQPYNTAPQWIGQIWDGNSAVPVISDLLGAKPLTSRTIAGWKFTTKPTGGTWTGNGTAITSSAIATTPYSYTAAYWAGGNSISREFTDFGVSEELLSLYFAAQTENFTLWLDDLAYDGIVAGAQVLEADNPAGLTIGTGFSALIDGVAQVIANKAGVPTFALVKASLYKEMLKTPQDSVLGYLNAALGLAEGELSGFQIRPVADATMAGNSVIVGVRSGADVYTLPGSPVRAEALQVATGQLDVGLFGYGAFVPNKADAFVAITPYVA